MLHMCISAYASGNGILVRLIALFPLLFTTSGDVLCSKFGEVWETLWIFKVARWTRNRWPKINKSPTISNGVGASSFEIWTANMAQLFTVGTLTNSQSFIFGDSNWKFCKVGYPVGPQNLTFRCGHFWLLGEKKIMLLVFSRKQQHLLDIQEHCICKLGKVRSGLKILCWCVLFIYWFLKLYTGIIWHSYFPSQGILEWKGSVWSGAKWVKCHFVAC